MSCKSVKYCNAKCQRNHGPKHKKRCKRLAASYAMRCCLRTRPICFLPMPLRLLCCVSPPDVTISSLPIYDFEKANKELANLTTEHYYPWCGKYICGGCIYSFVKSENIEKCPEWEQWRKGRCLQTNCSCKYYGFALRPAQLTKEISTSQPPATWR